MPAVRIRKLSKRFGAVEALQPSDLHLDDGQLSVIVGPSGCGKTTLMRLIAGLETPSSGTIALDEARIDQTPAWERDIALVFQNYALYPHMTVANNIQFPLVAQRVPREEREQRTEQVAERLEIAHLLQRKPRQLSGGQMQRVALGRALVRQPRLFLMDEPLSNLDAALRVTMRAEIKRLQHELDITMIYVTHDQVEAMTLADRLIVMNEGAIQQEGTPTDIYDRPANIFVAGFIGSPPMNILSCTYDAATRRLTHPNFSLAAPDIDGRESVGFFGIRPEALVVTTLDERHDAQGEVYVVEHLGKEILLTVQLGDALLKAIVAPDRSFQPGQPVGLRFLSSALHLFDDAGLRLVSLN